MRSICSHTILAAAAGMLMVFFAAGSGVASQVQPGEVTVLAQSSQSQTPPDTRGPGDVGDRYQRPYSPRYTDPYRYRSPAYRRGYQHGYRDERGTEDPAQRRDYRYEYGPRYRDENRYYGNRYRSYDGRYYGPRGPYGSPYRRYPGFGPYGSE